MGRLLVDEEPGHCGPAHVCLDAQPEERGLARDAVGEDGGWPQPVNFFKCNAALDVAVSTQDKNQSVLVDTAQAASCFHDGKR
ncbi:hypothetical protein MGU_09834 [Metarhizium guizhouense ARSEF 977]|uniref:Uncharacterized protein n=1 Tax=Metarhizium guizhouense (strain ARSEF 977) TaxID=1276136 RepID=A0A0B4G854_METGA|nr:hypothetical protein MGU_09834 [Metarhizium guizhouense ARSEF 977]